MADPSIQPAAAPSSRLAQIRQDKEKHWMWKAGIRAALCVIDIVAIGCAAWLVTVTNSEYSVAYTYDYYTFPGIPVGSLVVLCVAFVWCLLCLTIPFVLKPPRPLHPGIAVGVDLILWLAFIVVGLFTVGTIINIAYYGDGGVIYDPSYSYGYSGSYYLAPNNTWVYNITSVSTGEYYNYTSGGYEYPSDNGANVTRSCTPYFTTCAQQDAYVNKLWHEKPTTEGTTIVVSAVEWLGVLFHFILFVWACVDTHRYNAFKKLGKDQVIADRIVLDLEKRGLIQVRNGVIVSADAAPNNLHPNAPVNEPLLAPISHSDRDAITPL